MLPRIKIRHLMVLRGSVGTGHQSSEVTTPVSFQITMTRRSKTSFGERRLQKPLLITNQSHGDGVRVSSTMSLIFCTIPGPGDALKL